VIRLFSLPRLLGLGTDAQRPRHARRAHQAEADRTRAFLAGEEYRRRYAATPLFAESVTATGTEPGHNSQAGIAAWKASVR